MLRVFDISGKDLELLVKYECSPKLKVFHVNRKLELLVKYECLPKLKGLHVSKELELWFIVSVSQSTGYMISTRSFELPVR